MRGVQRALQGALLSLWLAGSCAVMAQPQVATPTDGLNVLQAQPVSQVEPPPVAATPVALQSLFPKLTGRVVDTAQLLTPSAALYLTQMLERLEQSTTDQVVVVTVPSLGGYSIEEFGVELGRHWGIGQKDKNNGVLLLVARDDRKVRIEVGYGLEGPLNDISAAMIIQNSIIPYFKDDLYSSGIIAGTTSIVRLLGPAADRMMVYHTADKGWLANIDWFGVVRVLFFTVLIGIPFAVFAWSWRDEGDPFRPKSKEQKAAEKAAKKAAKKEAALREARTPKPDKSWSFSFGSSGPRDIDSITSSSSSSSFSGGGGSFGGGGASGSW